MEADIIIQAKKFISSHLTVQFALKEIAKFCGYSIYHFSREFRKFTGMSVFAELSDFVIQADYQGKGYARQMLNKVKEIISDTTINTLMIR